MASGVFEFIRMFFWLHIETNSDPRPQTSELRSSGCCERELMNIYCEHETTLNKYAAAMPPTCLGAGASASAESAI